MGDMTMEGNENKTVEINSNSNIAIQEIMEKAITD